MTKNVNQKTYTYTKKRTNKNFIIKEVPFKNIESEYEFDMEKNPVFRLLDFLDKADRNMLIIYSELKSLVDTAKYLNISKTSINRKMKEIKKKIFSKLDELTEEEKEEIIMAMSCDEAKDKIKKI